MKVGDLITTTKDEFLRLAPLGLRLQLHGTHYFYSRDAAIACNYPTHDSAIPGYVLAYSVRPNRESAYSDHIRGCWGNFDPRADATFTVVRLPTTPPLYKRRT